GPARIPQPQRAAAARAEVAPGFAHPRFAVFLEPCAVDTQEALARHLHAPDGCAEVDRIATGARGLAADGAIAAHEGNRLRRFDGEADAAAMAGAFEAHGALPVAIAA